MQSYPLTKRNLKKALLSSGSIPWVMDGVENIESAVGNFRDGGMVDYHLNLDFLPKSDGLVLYPHFYSHVIPGWFDKGSSRRPSENDMSNVILISPSEKLSCPAAMKTKLAKLTFFLQISTAQNLQVVF